MYDALTAMKMLKQDVSSSDMAQALLNGFKYYETALPLDTIPEVNKDGSPKIDKKTGLQKVKVKYSAEIQNTLLAHINDFLTTEMLASALVISTALKRHSRLTVICSTLRSENQNLILNPTL